MKIDRDQLGLISDLRERGLWQKIADLQDENERLADENEGLRDTIDELRCTSDNWESKYKDLARDMLTLTYAELKAIRDGIRKTSRHEEAP